MVHLLSFNFWKACWQSIVHSTLAGAVFLVRSVSTAAVALNAGINLR